MVSRPAVLLCPSVSVLHVVSGSKVGGFSITMCQPSCLESCSLGEWCYSLFFTLHCHNNFTKSHSNISIACAYHQSIFPVFLSVIRLEFVLHFNQVLCLFTGLKVLSTRCLGTSSWPTVFTKVRASSCISIPCYIQTLWNTQNELISILY